MQKLIILVVLACAMLLADATVQVRPFCPGRARAGTNVAIRGTGYIDLRGSGSISWSLCDNLGRCSRGSDVYRGGRTRRSLNMFFMAYYRNRGSYSLTARLTAGGRTAIGRCSFVVG